jgi:hypothetical protein
MAEEEKGPDESQALTTTDVNVSLATEVSDRDSKTGRFVPGNLTGHEGQAIAAATKGVHKGKHFRTLFKEAMDREGRRRGQSLIEYCVELAYEDRTMAMLLCKALIEPQKPGTAISVEVENQVAILQAESKEQLAPPRELKFLTRRARESFRIVIEEVRQNHHALDGPETDEERRLPIQQGALPGETLKDLGKVEAHDVVLPVSKKAGKGGAGQNNKGRAR